MTTLQKQIIGHLLNGGSIAGYGSAFRLRDSQVRPVISFTIRTMDVIHKYCRRQNGLLVLDKKYIRTLHGKSWIKQAYKEHLTNKKTTA